MRANTSSRPSASDVRVALVHLGCARNLIDSETILGRLGSEGFALTGAIEDADVAVLNTCGFIGPAREESERAIENLLEHKREGRLRSVIVVGCLVEKFRANVERQFPEVDAFLGLSDYSNFARVVESVLKGRKLRDGVAGRRAAEPPSGLPVTGELLAVQGDGPRLLQTPRSYAYLRPSHGCDHTCSFCIIPAIRGRQRSKPVDVAVREATELVEQGVREIVLVAEDTTGYGTDLGKDGPRLPQLVDALANVPALGRLRLMYAYPYAFPWEVARAMRERPDVVPYLDIPIQHISTRVLKRMRRGGTRESVTAIIDRLREEVPGITLRTTVLVGHPGEGPAEFEELMEFLGSRSIERVGAFAFSPEAGTPSGEDLDRCAPEEAQRRLEQVMELQEQIFRREQGRRIGSTVEVLVDEREGDDLVGRSVAEAPEVDGILRVADPEGRWKVGDLLEAKIVALEDFDLRGEPTLVVSRVSARPSHSGVT